MNVLVAESPQAREDRKRRVRTPFVFDLGAAHPNRTILNRRSSRSLLSKGGHCQLVLLLLQFLLHLVRQLYQRPEPHLLLSRVKHIRGTDHNHLLSCLSLRHPSRHSKPPANRQVSPLLVWAHLDPLGRQYLRLVRLRRPDIHRYRLQHQHLVDRQPERVIIGGV